MSKLKINSKSAAIILIKNGKALLQLRDNKPNISYPNCWGFAGGGRLNEGETFINAAKRELKEETGYVSKKPIYFMTSIYVLPNGTVVKAKRYFERYDGVQKINCFEGQKVEFYSIDELNKLKFFPGVKQAVINAIELSLIK